MAWAIDRLGRVTVDVRQASWTIPKREQSAA
jgi:hypothetical protein